MLVTKVNPVGIDWYIQQMQTFLHTRLLAEWGIAEADYMSYGRCHRNKTDDGYIAQVYTGGKDYKEIYWDDAKAAVSFFGMNNNITRNVKSQADVHLVFFVNLDKLALKDQKGNTIAHRADEEIRTMVQKLIGKNSFCFELKSMELWIENVLKEYPGSRRDERLKFVDMHPVHCFRLNFTIIYDQNKIC